MSVRPTLLFLHGWGFDATFWGPLRAMLSDWPQRAIDRGYFDTPGDVQLDKQLDKHFDRHLDTPTGERVAPQSDAPGHTQNPLPGAYADERFIVIGHSFGFLDALVSLPRPTDAADGEAIGKLIGINVGDKRVIAAVSINGFTRFSATDDFSEGVSPRVIDRMMTKIRSAPEAVVDDFRRRCGWQDGSSPMPSMDVERLLADLQTLKQGDGRDAYRALTSHALPCLVLAGEQDAIVPPAMTQAAFADRTIVWLATGDHLLPTSATAWCAQHITAFLETLAAVPLALPRHSIAERFGTAVNGYESHAHVQRLAAARLAKRIAALDLPRRPRILEIGCGTGLFTRALAEHIGEADWTITDIAGPMVDAARSSCPLIGTSCFLALDGEHPEALEGATFDLICSNFAMQWFDDLNSGLGRLASYLAPGGHLMITTLAQDTFCEWRDAHRAERLPAGARSFPACTEIALSPPTATVSGSVEEERLITSEGDGLAFLRGLKHIGATKPAEGLAPLSASALKRVIARFNDSGAHVTYHIAYGHWHKTATDDVSLDIDGAPASISARPQGVFVTGTDTGIGKTLVSAVLSRAWEADYWKPVQTGLAEETGDTTTVSELAALDAARLHAPAYALQAPLSPWAAAPLEGVAIDATTIQPPKFTGTLIAEGAGGLYVPIDASTMMIDLISRLGFPVVLVARSGLGTINHTLLSLETLRLRGVPLLGVVMVGVLNPGNRDAIERFGNCAVILDIPHLDLINADVVKTLAATVPALPSLLARLAQTLPPG